jgi:hypothetical protein
VRRLFSPLQPDDYLEMINPLWTTKELRGKVARGDIWVAGGPWPRELT